MSDLKHNLSELKLQDQHDAHTSIPGQSEAQQPLRNGSVKNDQSQETDSHKLPQVLVQEVAGAPEDSGFKTPDEKPNTSSTGSGSPSVRFPTNSSANTRPPYSRTATGNASTSKDRSGTPFASAASSVHGKEESPATSVGTTTDSLKPHGSSASLSSERSLNKKKAPSFLELKRFFGKGRKKHEHGVTNNEAKQGLHLATNASSAQAARSADSTPRKPVKFSLFGHSKKHHHHDNSSIGHDSAPNTPSAPSTPHTPQEETHSAHHGGSDHHDGGYFGLFRNRKKNKDDKNKDDKHSKKSKNTSDFIDPLGGGVVHVKGKPPADLDPNFVVHAPDYEAEWDPFHLFGLESNDEKLPFLESHITKYGEVGANVGSGAGGSVRTMERPSDHKVFAVKEFRARRSNETPQKYAKHVAAEYALGAALHHKNIIETIDLVKEGDHYYEVMEYGPQDFFEIVMSGTLNAAQVNSSFSQIMNGVAYLHSIGVAHRDLKLDNCVVTNEGVVKLIDFGSSVVFKYPMSPKIHLARGIMGSDPYLAPEVFLKHPYQPQYADVWSCGIIYACTYMRRFPWRLPQNEDVSYRKFAANPSNIHGEPGDNENPKKITGPWRLLRLIPSEARPLILKLLMIEVKSRISMEQAVEDPWFKSIKQISVLPKKLEQSSGSTAPKA